MDRGAWRATVHGVSKSWTRLSTHTAKVYRVTSCGDENVLKWTVVIDAQLCEYTGNRWIGYFKWANYRLCAFISQ